jgi:hypothetical protein
LYRIIYGYRAANLLKKSILEKLDQLDTAESSVIREFYFDGASTIKLPINNPAVAELLRQGVVEQVGSLGEQSMVGILLPLRLSKLVRERISPKHLGLSPFLIENPNSDWKITDEGISWVRNNRPSFMHEIYRRQALLEGRLYY